MSLFSLKGQSDTASQKGIDRVAVTGIVNFITFYRDMSHTFPGTSDAGKSWAFSPYKLSNNSTGNYLQQPILTLNLSAHPTPTTSFAVDYTLTHLFSGLDSSKSITAQNLFQFHGDVENKWGAFHLRAGGGSMIYSLSPLTIYNKSFREPTYERLPWEWRMNSFDIYKDNYNSVNTSIPSSNFNTAMQGVIFEADDLPYQLGFSSFYGRSNTTITPTSALLNYPLQLIAGKVYKVLGHNEQVALNFYNQFGFTNTVDKIKDSREIISASYEKASEKIQFHGELGLGKLNNPDSDKTFGEALKTSFTLLNKEKKMPISLQVYRISKNVAALESAVLNSNSAVHQGGYSADRKYENSLYPAYLQEVDMLANNRQGVIFGLDKSFKSLKVELGYALSRELENQFQGVSYQHMANSFSRSRFEPWVMGAGPYGRVSNRFRNSFETIALTDPSLALKTFNAADLKLKSKFIVFDRELILMNFTYLGNTGNTLSPFDKKYIKMIYEEFSAYYQTTEKFNVLLFYSIQNAKGGTGTEKATNGNYLNQTAHGYGFGLDYDIMKNAGIYLRHRWMNQSDKNFSADTYKGTETTLELKYYF